MNWQASVEGKVLPKRLIKATEENHEKHVVLACVPRKIRTRGLPNTSKPGTA
jgi:hypothetical protein